jgi:hypothetical protein
MPIFHFNVHDGTSYPDTNGLDLPDIATARKVAVKLASDLLRDQGDTFWNGDDWQIEVTDSHHLTLFMIMFSGVDAPALGKA